MEAAGIKKGSYENRRLEIRARIYLLDKKDLDRHDVDNRLKDIMDALQGRMGGSKKVHEFETFIPNDAQICSVSICKQLASPQSKNRGHVEIREYR